MKRTAAILCLTAAAMHAAASDSVIERYAGTIGVVGAQAYSSPALMPMLYAVPIGSVGVGYEAETGQRNGRFAASAIRHTANSSMWGHASYTNGRTDYVQWSDMPQPQQHYPYVLADSIGGYLDAETYSFGGGYSRRRGAMLYAAQAQYTALMSHRARDPRPRTTSGTLNMALAVARSWGGYTAALTAGYTRMHSSTDVITVSTVGETKLFHLTGLGAHYMRFAGLASSASTAHNVYRLQLAAVPQRSGFLGTAYVKASRADYRIPDLNNLPMSHTAVNTAGVEGGWRNAQWLLSGAAQRQQLNGTENLFGDAVGGVYPLIGSQTAYRHSLLSVNARAVHTARVSRFTVQGQLSGRVSSFSASRIMPQRAMHIRAAGGSAQVSSWGPLSKGLVSARVGAAYTRPYSSGIDAQPTADVDGNRILQHLHTQFSSAIQPVMQVETALGYAWPLSSALALSANVSLHSNNHNFRGGAASLSLIF